MSARDMQARELPIGMGPGKAKDWDGSNVLGPASSPPTSSTAPTCDGLRVNGEDAARRPLARRCTTPSAT